MKVLPNVGASLRQITQAINELIQGRSNAAGDVTLAPGQTTTVVTRDTLSNHAVVMLTPQTANAAAAIATTFATVSPAGGSFTVHHANAATTDRTFSWLAVGG